MEHGSLASLAGGGLVSIAQITGRTSLLLRFFRLFHEYSINTVSYVLIWQG
jgi:hypothetical protein